MKCFKKIIYSILLIAICLIPKNINAASGSYSISSNSSVTSGSNISVTFTINSNKMFYWQAYITYDTSKLQLVSGSKTFQGESDDIRGLSKVSQTLVFKATNSGTAWVKISMGDKDNNINTNSENISFPQATKNITINQYVPKVYSTNNKLKSLSVEGYKLTPEFKNSVFEYSVELPEKTEKIKVNATKEDDSATVSGTGEIKVNEGNNRIVIKVTAENGNVKEYIINAKVKELEPIYVELGNKKYTLVRKKEELKEPNSTYTLTSIKIDKQDIPAYKSEITGYYLVGLKDIEGLANLFIYDESKNTYTKYSEIKFNNLIIFPTNNEKINLSSKYKKFIENINGTEVIVYKTEKSSNYSIFEGINIESGKKNIYVYEKTESTVQIYNNENATKKSNASNTNIYVYTTIGLFSALILMLLILLIYLIRKNKKPKKIKLN